MDYIQGYEKVGDDMFLYIGKAKWNVSARYSKNDLYKYSIEALDKLKTIPNNGTALGLEQQIMKLNGFVNKQSNIANRTLSNVNNATVKEIYNSAGLKWLNKNVPNWKTEFKFQ